MSFSFLSEWSGWYPESKFAERSSAESTSPLAHASGRSDHILPSPCLKYNDRGFLFLKQHHASASRHLKLIRMTKGRPDDEHRFGTCKKRLVRAKKQQGVT